MSILPFKFYVYGESEEELGKHMYGLCVYYSTFENVEGQQLA